MDILKLLGNKNRRKILKLLLSKERHINGIARDLGISAPTVYKHLKILQENGIVEKEEIGNLHQYRVKEGYLKKLEKIFRLSEESSVIKAREGDTLSEVMGGLSEIKIQETKRGHFIKSISGKGGSYIYKVNGKLPNEPINEYEINKDITVTFYQLRPVLDRKYLVKCEEKSSG